MPTIILILITIFIIGFIGFLSSPQGKGLYGEWLIKTKIGKTTEPKKFVFNNCMFKTDHKTLQIDHIIVSNKGIIVIETKNYSGYIYGNDEQHEWTQVFQYGKIKNKFYNPVKQNQSHCYFIKSLINNKSVPVISIVVFIKNNIENIKSTSTVIGLNTLKKHIKSLQDKISDNEVSKIANIINLNLNKEISTKEHVKNIQQTLSNIENNICPRCNAQLVKKQGKYGEFLGCSNYPKCKFIKKDGH